MDDLPPGRLVSRRHTLTLLAASTAAVAVVSPGPTAAAATGQDRTAEGYRIGIGRSDITGEPAEAAMMGYARLNQVTSGISMRQWARAFVIADANGSRVLFVNTDLGMIMQGVHQEVLRRLAARFPDRRYSDANVLLTATHTHAGPGGFSHYALYNLTILGYRPETFEAIVSGIVAAIEQADASLAPGTIKIASGELATASVNRARVAFDRNPAAERAVFPDAIDPRMTVLRLERAGRPVGAISWFATHGTSMTPTNTLISSDNKGYAEQTWESPTLAPSPGFVAAFAQTNAGDMSPNIRDGGYHGPTDDEFENTRIIGTRQLDVARALFDRATETLSGPVDCRQRYVDFSNITVSPDFTGDGQTHRTFPAAVGQAFTAGAPDGPGPDIVRPGDTTLNPLLLVAGTVVAPASSELRAGQAPKPVFLATGTQQPFPWSPQILPLQILRIGRLVLAAVPVEVTIVAGLRLRRSVATALGTSPDDVLVTGYSNAYSGYLVTPEEYDAQYYEGASTNFGRWTLPAYQQELSRLATEMARGVPSSGTLVPPDLSGHQIVTTPGILFDDIPLGLRFGDIAEQPGPTVARGRSTYATFWTGHPNNNLHHNTTYLEIQLLVNGGWTTVADDDAFETVYRWKRVGIAYSQAKITWNVPLTAVPGTYRIVHYGDWKSGWTGGISPLTGISRNFTVT
ncbi:neutral/alkaline ceramidase [Kitasatospora sp. NPDC048540]|uniref:neutral/alkaline ceramidase n=1 Tax=Kitasatospora sp. NPDC048540 TaxID=3155634 RepID=UPI0033D71333